eukprot:gnl/Chilomastix_cuspidata/4453.p1 GENE.gnl/Chilomastix_cuspidata/4453~~gnl/Chilomastix_cuspidata/4453.p1  ORF type:complete len:771 (+),score=206.46 gnl/Chilomastix_cuspidata/4453:108-2420(+)
MLSLVFGFYIIFLARAMNPEKVIMTPTQARAKAWETFTIQMFDNSNVLIGSEGDVTYSINLHPRQYTPEFVATGEFEFTYKVTSFPTTVTVHYLQQAVADFVISERFYASLPCIQALSGVVGAAAVDGAYVWVLEGSGTVTAYECVGTALQAVAGWTVDLTQYGFSTPSPLYVQAGGGHLVLAGAVGSGEGCILSFTRAGGVLLHEQTIAPGRSGFASCVSLSGQELLVLDASSDEEYIYAFADGAWKLSADTPITMHGSPTGSACQLVGDLMVVQSSLGVYVRRRTVAGWGAHEMLATSTKPFATNGRLVAVGDSSSSVVTVHRYSFSASSWQVAYTVTAGTLHTGFGESVFFDGVLLYVLDPTTTDHYLNVFTAGAAQATFQYAVHDGLAGDDMSSVFACADGRFAMFTTSTHSGMFFLRREEISDAALGETLPDASYDVKLSVLFSSNIPISYHSTWAMELTLADGTSVASGSGPTSVNPTVSFNGFDPDPRRTQYVALVDGMLLNNNYELFHFAMPIEGYLSEVPSTGVSCNPPTATLGAAVGLRISYSHGDVNQAPISLAFAFPGVESVVAAPVYDGTDAVLTLTVEPPTQTGSVYLSAPMAERSGGNPLRCTVTVNPGTMSHVVVFPTAPYSAASGVIPVSFGVLNENGAAMSDCCTAALSSASTPATTWSPTCDGGVYSFNYEYAPSQTVLEFSVDFTGGGSCAGTLSFACVIDFHAPVQEITSGEVASLWAVALDADGEALDAATLQFGYDASRMRSAAPPA